MRLLPTVHKSLQPREFTGTQSHQEGQGIMHTSGRIAIVARRVNSLVNSDTIFSAIPCLPTPSFHLEIGFGGLGEVAMSLVLFSLMT